MFLWENIGSVMKFAVSSNTGASPFNAGTLASPQMTITNSVATATSSTSAPVTIAGGLGVSGDVIVSGNVTAYSDITLKDNIEIIPNALNKVTQTRGVTYTRTDLEDKLKRHTGVIAQEIESVLPEAVMTDADGIKSVAYGNVIGLLIEAIKELDNKVDSLQKQLDEKNND
jgi:Chaperone of endosialidase